MDKAKKKEKPAACRDKAQLILDLEEDSDHYRPMERAPKLIYKESDLEELENHYEVVIIKVVQDECKSFGLVQSGQRSHPPGSIPQKESRLQHLDYNQALTGIKV